MLNHIIAKEGNYMWATFVVLMPIYLIYLIFAVNIPGDYFYGVTSGVMLFFGYLRYCAMIEIWSRTEISDNKQDADYESGIWMQELSHGNRQEIQGVQ